MSETEQVERLVALVTPEEHMRFKVACARAKPKTMMAAQLRKLALEWVREQEESDARNNQ